MSTELFINKAILPFLVWMLVCLPLLWVILVAYDRMTRKRPITAVVLEPMPLTAEQEHDLCTALQALDRVVATLEREESSALLEAELVLEQYQAKLEMEQEG